MKILLETAMEGYHIKALHNKTFYPYGFDNLNIVETFGMNSRIVFPFRRIEKLREIQKMIGKQMGCLPMLYKYIPMRDYQFFRIIISWS